MKKIALINTGLVPIPLDHEQDFLQWGAIEKIMFFYRRELNKLGYEAEIVSQEVLPNSYDLYHVFIANQAISLHNRNIKYVFSPNDHHAMRFGKSSGIYNENKKAIENSILSLVSAEFLIDYFESPYKTFYLTHGVDTKFFSPVKKKEHRLLCLANNGYADNPTEDRKGFRKAIELAKMSNLPITICGPTNNNKRFFDSNKDLLAYKKLEILYDLKESQLKNIFNDHSIFVHFSELEFGQPNLTLMEALASGLPIIGYFEGRFELPGMSIIKKKDNVIEKLNHIISNYDNYSIIARKTSLEFDWCNIVKKIDIIYSSLLNINNRPTNSDFELKIQKTFNNIEVSNKQIIKKNLNQNTELKPKVYINFVEGAFCEVIGGPNKEYFVDFFDKKNNKLIHRSTIKPNCWAKTFQSYYTDWQIILSDNGNKVYEYNINLKNKNVYIALDSKSLGDTIAWFPYVEEFRKKHECLLVCSTFHNYLFKDQYLEIKFVEPGDVVSDLTAMYKIGCFDINNRHLSPKPWNQIPLQKVASDILGLEFKEIRPRISQNDKERVIKEKYICIGTESTAQLKYWNNPNGWKEMVKYFNNKGYKVINITKNDTKIPGTQQFKGSISEIIPIISHCDLYIGLASGGSWLAWGLGKHVVMISGFSNANIEFESNCTHIEAPSDTCHGCYSRTPLDKNDWLFCPEHKNTLRQFECSKKITPEHVIKTIEFNKLT